MSITTEVRNDLIALVVGVYGAAPGTALLSTLANTYIANPNMAAVALSLQSSAPFIAAYPSFMTNTEFATRVVDNILEGRVSAADRTWAIDTLVASLNSGAGRAELILTAVIELRKTTNPDWANAKAAFANQVEVATYHTVTQQKDGTLAERVAVIANVDQTAASVEAAKVAQGGQAATDAAETVTLTASVQALTTGTGDDIFNAAPGVNATTGAATTTLNAGDSIDGGAGRDTLNITATATNNNSLAGITVTGIEVINIAGGNNLGGNSAAVAAAATALATAESGLATASAAAVLAGAKAVAASAVDDLMVAAEGEDALAFITSSATAAQVASKTAAAMYLDTTAYDTYAEVLAVASLQAVPTGVTAFTLAEMKAAANALLVGVDGSSNINNDAAVAARGEALAAMANEAANYVVGAINTDASLTARAFAMADVLDVAEAGAAFGNTTLASLAGVTSLLQLQQVDAAAAAVQALVANAEDAGAVAAVTAALAVNTSPSDAFTLAQYKAALTAVQSSDAGVVLTAGITGVTAVDEVQDITFAAMVPGDSVTVGGLTAFTTVALTAVQAAALFAGTAADATAGEAVTGVFYSGAFAEDISIGAQGAPSATVVATSTAEADIPLLAVSATGTTAPVVAVETEGVAAVTAFTAGTGMEARAGELEDVAEAMLTEVGAALAAGTYSVADFAAAYSDATKAAYTGTTLTTVVTVDARAGVLETLYGEREDAAEDIGGTVTFAQLKTAAVAATVSATGASLITSVNDTAAIEARAEGLVTATGDVVTASGLVLATATGVDSLAQNELEVLQAGITNGSVSAAQFVGSEELWLSGSSNLTNVTGITTQTIGLSGLSGINSTLSFGAATGSIYSKGSTGSLSITGAKALSLTGTTGTLTLDATSTSLNVGMTGANTLTVTAMAALEVVNISGAGKTTLVGLGTSVKTIESTSGAVVATISTATVKDNPTTDLNETVNASVTTSSGADTIVIATTGTGTTSVSTGGGVDTIVLGRALSELDSINGGDGIDTLVTAGRTYVAQDYIVLNAAVSNVEAMLFTSAVTAEATRLNKAALVMEAGGTLTEASGVGLTTWGSLTASSTGYDETDGVIDTVYGGSLAVTLSGGTRVSTATTTGSGSTLTLNASTATATINASSIGSLSSTINGDVETLVVNLANSATKTADSLASTTITVSATENQSLKSVDLNGTGSVTINTSAAAEDAIVLATIDASGLGGKTLYDNGLTSSTKGNVTGGLTFTGNSFIAETIILGSGADSVTVNSTYAKMDTISGADFVKETSTSKSVTDVIIFGGLTLNGAVVDQIDELEISASATSLDLAFLQAAAASAADSNATLFFAFEGNTYLFKNQGTAALEDADLAVKIVGIVDLTDNWGVYAG